MHVNSSGTPGRAQAADGTAPLFGPVPGYRILRAERSTPALPLQLIAEREGPYGFRQSCVLEATRTIEAGGDPRLVRALLADAAVASRVRHQSAGIVHDVLEHDGWIVLVRPNDGNLTLAHLTAALGRHTRRLDESIVWHVAHTLFDTLDEVHHTLDQEGNPIVHGDLRPGNVIVRPDGGLVLRGFGGTRAWFLPAGEAGRRGLYDCPLQLEGSPPSIATDLYAAAAVVWELLVDASLAARYHAPGALLNSAEERALPSLTVVRPEIHSAAAAAIDLCLSMDPDAPTCTAANVANIIHRSTDALAGRERLARLHGNVFARMGHARSRWATAPSRPGGVDCDAPTERHVSLPPLDDDDTETSPRAEPRSDIGLEDDDPETLRVARPHYLSDGESGATPINPPVPIPSFPPVSNDVPDGGVPQAGSPVRARSRMPSALLFAAALGIATTLLIPQGWRPYRLLAASSGERISPIASAGPAADPQPSAQPLSPAPAYLASPAASPARTIPVWRSSLVVHGPPDGVVFVQGKPLGRTGVALETPCGLRNVRVGTQPVGGVMVTVTWLAPGQALMLPCGGAIERPAQ